LLADLLLPDATHLRLDTFTVQADLLTVEVTSIQSEVICPSCDQPSQRVHSRYQRTLADLPWAGRQVNLHVQVRRFYCPNPTCPRTTFSERLPALVAPSARRTGRLAQEQCALGFDLGGEAGARTAQRQGMPVSPDTLLRLVRDRPLQPAQTPRVLSVDDWAKRKGKTYGTILVDLEQHRVVDLLADRTAESLATWLKEHPGVEIITRDRSTTYAEGATQGAPEAVQVADRWHLLKNLVDTVEDILARNRPHLSRSVPLSEPCPAPEGAVPACDPPPMPITYAERVRLRHRAERVQRYQQVMALREQGIKLHEIAHQVAISERTVNRFLAAGTYPERKRRSSSKAGLLEGHTHYLDQRWAEGCTNATQLWRELCGQGFTGSASLVLTYVAQLRHGEPLSIRPATPTREVVVRRYTPRQAAVLFVRRPEEVDEAEEQDIAHMVSASAEIAATYELAQRFAQMVRQRLPETLSPWLEAAHSTIVTEFRQFGASLAQDKAAVAAALQYPWSNGQAEGQINRLKLIKRKMYGRANFDLLRQRVLAA
jgi:transposase